MIVTLKYELVLSSDDNPKLTEDKIKPIALLFSSCIQADCDDAKKRLGGIDGFYCHYTGCEIVR